MKRIELARMMDFAPGWLKDAVLSAAKEADKKTDDLSLCRCDHSEKARVNAIDEELEAGSRKALKYVSTRTLDRDKEVVLPKGLVLKEFEKYRHVLFGHNYNLPIIGADESLTLDDWGLKVVTVYGDTGEGTLADIQWRLVKQGLHKASSIGFVPLAWTEPGHNDWDKVANKLEKDWPEFRKDDTKRVITKAMLLEHSDVPVPANVDSNVIAVAKGAGADEKMLRQMGYGKTLDMLGGLDALDVDPDGHVKAVIPYRDYGNAAKDRQWSGPREVAAASIDVLRRICAWYDADNADVKGGYKLPHHTAGGGNPAVWRGVTAAMAALLGARGGVDLPASDRRGIHAHLSRHYRDFDEEPPEFREYTAAELKAAIPEACEPIDNGPTPPTVHRAHRPIVRVISEPPPFNAELLAAQAAKDALDMIRGRV